ncbi:MAG: 50S ribosomal protein L31 [Candidatus Uhrbacteria bacterium]
MRKGIHPTYHQKAKISCVCGHSITVGSTKEETQVELCAKCHPFFTGKQKIVDSARRVDRFQQLVAKKGEAATARTGRKVKRAKDVENRKSKQATIEKE